MNNIDNINNEVEKEWTAEEKVNIKKKVKKQKHMTQAQCVTNFLKYMKQDYKNIPMDTIKKMKKENPEKFEKLIREYSHVILRASEKVREKFEEEISETLGTKLLKKEKIYEDRHTYSIEHAKKLITILNYQKSIWILSVNDEKEIQGRVINVILKGRDIPLLWSNRSTIERPKIVIHPNAFDKKPFHGRI